VGKNYGIYNKLPIDSEIRKYFFEKYKIKKDDDIYDKLKIWEPYQFLGYKIKRIIEKNNYIN
jgi:hypothetical protein